MATLGQILANRENAQKSTGPKTALGKEQVAHNPVKHGMRAERVILPDEDAAEFEAMRSGLYEEFRPDGAEDTMLVEQYVVLWWRRRRCDRAETALFNRAYAAAPAGGTGEGAPLADAFCAYGKELALLARYTNQIVREMAALRKVMEAMRERNHNSFKQSVERAAAKNQVKIKEAFATLQKEHPNGVAEEAFTALEDELGVAFDRELDRLVREEPAYEQPQLAWVP